MMKKHVCALSQATFRISFSERSRAREWRIVQSGLLFMSYYISGVGRVVIIYETGFLICASRGRNERVESCVRVTGRCGISRAYDANRRRPSANQMQPSNLCDEPLSPARNNNISAAGSWRTLHFTLCVLNSLTNRIVNSTPLNYEAAFEIVLLL
jgi:hypothetical protein